MEEHTKEDVESAKKLLNFYINMVENNISAVKFYLSDNVVLDWFGKTVKDNKKVSLFIKDQMCRVTHHITNTFPSENVAFKETHHVTVPTHENNVLIPSPTNEKDGTPPKKNLIVPSTSTIEMGQGDGVHNCLMMSPPKKMKFESDSEDNEIVEGESETKAQLKYITAEGSVEFHKPSIKKLQTETRWRRPIKLHIGYTTSSYKDCTIYLIIYEGNLKCRRNLYKEFCESDTSTKASV